MRKSTKLAALGAVLIAAAITATSASAALFVSGDSNIANNIDTTAPNQTFFENIVEGSSVVVQNSTRTFLNTQATALVNFYNTNGFTASLLGAASLLTGSTLAGIDLFIAYAPDDAFSAAEVGILSTFLSGGGDVLITAENSSFPDLINIVNNLLNDLGSSMQIVRNNIDAGFHTAFLQGPSAFLAGTTGLQYAATSLVTGGQGLYGTETGNQTFLAVEQLQSVPEPSALALLAFGLAGLAVAKRRRQ